MVAFLLLCGLLLVCGALPTLVLGTVKVLQRPVLGGSLFAAGVAMAVLGTKFLYAASI